MSIRYLVLRITSRQKNLSRMSSSLAGNVALSQASRIAARNTLPARFTSPASQARTVGRKVSAMKYRMFIFATRKCAQAGRWVAAPPARPGTLEGWPAQTLAGPVVFMPGGWTTAGRHKNQRPERTAAEGSLCPRRQ